MLPDVLVILVNFRSPDDTIECLETVLKSDYPNFSVVVVDNSGDNSSIEVMEQWARGETDHVKTSFPNLVYPLVPKPIPYRRISDGEQYATAPKSLTVIQTQNRGFAAANNVAIRTARKNNFSFYWLLNNDTVIEPSSLSALVRCAEDSRQCGILGSKLCLYHQPHLLQGIGANYNPWLGKVKEIGAMDRDEPVTRSANDFDYVIGASMFVRDGFIAEVGLMEEDYFLYYEELDWAIRGKRKGWKLGYCAASKVYHKMGASINKDEMKGKGNSELSDFYAVRNRILITRKFFPIARLTLYPAFLKFIFTRIRLKQFSRILMLFRIFLHPHRHFMSNEKS
jgi:GT2 family glycosyltransferase